MLRTDEQIKKDILYNLSENKFIEDSNIKVKVNKGVVTLKGTVPDYAAQISATLETKSVDGVIKIKNMLAVENNSKDMHVEFNQLIQTAKPKCTNPNIIF